MTEIIETDAYIRLARKLGLTNRDRAAIRRKLGANPTAGTGIGGSVYKLRENYVVYIYLKSVQADLTPQQYETLRKAAREQRARRLNWLRKRTGDIDE